MSLQHILLPKKSKNHYIHSDIQAEKSAGNRRNRSFYHNKLFEKFKRMIHKLFTSLPRLNYFTEVGKLGELSYFLKDGKDPSCAFSYRPVTLLENFDKVYEKLELRSLNYHLLNSKYLTFNQQGLCQYAQQKQK